MDKVVMFGAGKNGRNCFYNPWKKFEIIAVLDNNADLQREGTKLFEGKVPLIGIDEYMASYSDYDILIAIADSSEVEEQLKSHGITNFKIVHAEVLHDKDANVDLDIRHTNWVTYLSERFNKQGMEILEVGSRCVTGGNLRDHFSKAHYTGFDYYAGENVDVVGDAHELSSYFDHQFDLIFSSAVFEHLAMPWKASAEIIKLLKPGGFVFIETHYSYSSHERPWHFFQFSENALDVLFPEKFGMQCIKMSVDDLIEGQFSTCASAYLAGQKVRGLYCHSEYLGQKIREVDELSWNSVTLSDVVKSTEYPKPGKV